MIPPGCFLLPIADGGGGGGYGCGGGTGDGVARTR